MLRLPARPAGDRRPCPSCGCDVPAYYIVRGRACWDCIIPGRGWPPRRRRPRVGDADVAAVAVARAPADKLPAATPAALATLTENQRRLYAAVRAGVPAAVIARAKRVSRAAVTQSVRRLAARLAAAGAR